MWRSIISIVSVFLGLAYATAARATTYSEPVNGDLSGDRLVPTAIALTAGSNTITATSAAGDLEYFKLTVPAGFRLSAVNVVSSTSTSLSFIAVQRGSTFTEPPTGTVVGQLLGYTHFGPANGTIGTDILDNLGTGAGAMGFVPPLQAGVYTFWSQETSATASTYTLDFVVSVAPAPVPVSGAPIVLLAIGLAVIGAGRLRKPSRRCGLAASV